jgi:hypothetical protein
MRDLWRTAAAVCAIALAASVAFAIAAGPASAHPRCVESVNPHGQTIPPAGSTTLPGPRGGQNEDGFYRLTVFGEVEGTEIDRRGIYDILVIDLGSGTQFGPYPQNTTIKYTQAPGATPGEKKIGSTNGQAGAVLTHITGTGDLQLKLVWAVGNPVGATPGELVRLTDGTPIAAVTCYVPPPPK